MPLLISKRNNSWGYRGQMRTGDILTNFISRLFRNLGTSTSWNPVGL